MMMLYFWFTVSTEDPTYTAGVHIFDGMNMLKYSYCMIILDERNLRRFVEIIGA